MENKVLIANAVKNKRISLNLTSEQLANACGISRSTLVSIENGKGNYSIDALISVFNNLSLNLDIINTSKIQKERKRAKRINTKLDKKINRFIVFAIEQYASSVNKKSSHIYKLMQRKGIISELERDYEDLHGMSTISLNSYLDSLLKGQKL